MRDNFPTRETTTRTHGAAFGAFPFATYHTTTHKAMKSTQQKLYDRLRSVFVDAGEDVPDTEADAPELPQLDAEAWIQFEPNEHSSRLDEIRERVEAVEQELQDAGAAKEALKHAEKRLHAVQVRHKTGDATGSELEAAEQAMQNAKDALKDERTAREALHVLKMKECNAFGAVYDAYRAQARRVYLDEAARMIQPMRKLEAILETLQEMHRAGKAHSSTHVTLLRASPEQRDMGEDGPTAGRSPMQRATKELPSPLPLDAVRDWLNQYDPERTKK